MTLSINAFRQAGETNASCLVRGSNDSIVSGGCALPKCFSWMRTSSSKAANTQVAVAFRNALVKEFGERTTADAFNKSISLRHITDGKPISAKQVRTILAEVDALRAQSTAKLLSRMSTPGLGDGAYQRPRLDNLLGFSRLSCVGQTSLDLTREVLDKTTDLLAQVPTTTEEQADFNQKAAELHRDLNRLFVETLDIDDHLVVEELQREIPEAMRALVLKQAEVDRICTSNPYTAEHIYHARSNWYDCAINYLDQNLDALTGSIPAEHIAPIVDAKDKIAQMKASDPFGNMNPQTIIPADKVKLDELINDLNKIVMESFGGKRTAKEVRAKLEQSWTDTINKHQNWSSISHTVSLVMQNKTITPTCTLTPAGDLGNIFTPSYQGGGVGCYSFSENKHAVNLTQTSLTLPDSSGRPRTLFQGLRHAAHCASGIKNSEARKAANIERAKETVKAALLTHPDLLDLALTEATDNPGNMKPISVPITSVSLLTPDKLRSSGFINFFRDMSRLNERRMVREQQQAWSELSKGPIKLTVLTPQGTEQEVLVQPQATMFNFGVNRGAMGFPNLSNLLGGWDESDKVNQQAMSTLQSRIDVYFAENHPDGESAMVRQLFDQITTMWNEKSYRKPGNEPYKMASRLVLLTHVMGDVPAFNCKSGKDRTGALDIEAKFLALRTVMNGGNVPAPDTPLTGEERAALRALALGSGNHELQELNTGFCGFKLTGVFQNEERLGEYNAVNYFKGASSFTSS